MKRSATILISTASGFVLLAAGTTAGAAIAGPIDSSGVIYGCFTTKANGAGSHTLVLQDVGTTCPANTTAIKWNQTGPQGPAGPTGSAGPVGPQGPKGDTGATGPAGPAGPAGPQGLKGDTGAAGPTGPAGATGPAGPVGATGPQGQAGADGNTVLNGTGAPAVTVGNNGDFYLDVAADVLYGPKVRGGWPANGVSLVGPAGATGPQGPKGDTGAQGPPGNDGAQGPAGPAGPAGPQGTAGPAGPQGPAGVATAGPAGLDTVLRFADNSQSPGAPFASVSCPADHPYVLSGGYSESSIIDANGNVTPPPGNVTTDIPTGAFNTGGTPTPQQWFASEAPGPAFPLTVYAICAK